MAEPPVVIAGAGVFGVTAALELRARGHDVALLDPGPLPNPRASTVDASKAVRLDYGGDVFWTDLAERARRCWLEWNAWLGEPVYHEHGFLFLRRKPMQPGDFEHESLRLLTERGWRLDRLDARAIAERFPAWREGGYADGYFNPNDGWSPSGRVLELLLVKARDAGVSVREGTTVTALVEEDGRVRGVAAADGREHAAETVVVAAGAWTPFVLPWLADRMWPVGQPVVRFAVRDSERWRPPRFPAFASDIATTGWYGFPDPGAGDVKIANHGPGRRVMPDEPLAVLPDEEERTRAFLRAAVPELAAAAATARRLCLYCDTFDGSFWIDRDPDRDGLVVATGGSGHAFKFAPLLGGWIADVVERKPAAPLARFAWRARGKAAAEGARRR